MYRLGLLCPIIDYVMKTTQLYHMTKVQTSPDTKSLKKGDYVTFKRRTNLVESRSQTCNLCYNVAKADFNKL